MIYALYYILCATYYVYIYTYTIYYVRSKIHLHFKDTVQLSIKPLAGTN